jgi:hypothetical protein
LAVAAALLTAARDNRFVSAAVDFPEEVVEVEFSRRGSRPREPNDLEDGASDLSEALLILDGLGGYELELGKWFELETLIDGWGVSSFWVSFSDCSDSREDTEDWVPALSIREVRDGEPTGVLVCESAEIAAIA